MRARRVAWVMVVWLATGCVPRPGAKRASAPAAVAAVEEEGDGGGSSLPKPAFLAYVPADTPFFFGALRPLPADYAAREYVSRLAGYEKVRSAVERLMRERPRAAGRIALAVRLQVALLAELGGAATPEKLAEKLAAVGLDPATVGALYGVGMHPVVRIQLSEPARFAALLGRMAARLPSMERAALGNQRYYAARDEEVLWVLAVAGRDLVIAIIPPGERAALLPVVFGQELPERSMFQDRTLERLAAEYKLDPVGVGFADLTRVAASLGDALAPPCREELDQLAAAVPRVAIGLTQASGERVLARSIIEMREDLAGSIASLRGEVPRPDPDGAPAPIAIAAAIDVSAALERMAGAIDQVAAHPYRCRALAWLNDLARTQRGMLRQTARALVGVRGASVAVRRLEKLALGRADVFFLFGTDRPGELLGRLTRALNAPRPALEPGGPPAEIKSPLGNTFGPVHAALGRRAVGLSIGAPPADLAELLSADSIDDPPLLSVRLDPQAFGPILRLAGAAGDARVAAMDPELARNLAEIEIAEMERFDDLQITVRPAPRGLEVQLDGRYPR
jgi:hypothetical protein